MARAAMFSNGKRMRSLLIIAPILLLLFSNGSESLFNDGIEILTEPMRYFGDPGNDTAIWNITTHMEAGLYSNSSQTINVNIVNYNVSHQDNVSLNFTVRNRGTGFYENNTSGNTTVLLSPGAIVMRSLLWLPTNEGDYEISISARNITYWNNDTDQSNNFATINVTIINYTDVSCQTRSPIQGASYEQSSMDIEAWVNNTGNQIITQGFNIDLEILNSTTMAVIYSDTDVISALDVQNPGVSYLHSFSWTPSATGSFIVNVSTNLQGDQVQGNNLSSIGFAIIPVSVRDFHITVEPRDQYADPGGDPVTIEFRIVNNGTMPDSYTYTITSGHNWIDPPSENPTQGTTGIVQPGSYERIFVDIRVPAGTGYDQVDRTRINATSQANGTLRRDNSSRVYTYEIHEVNVTLLSSPASGNPGDSINYNFRIKNEGNIGGAFNYRTSTLYGWESYVMGESAPHSTSYLLPEAFEDVTVTVLIPELNYQDRETDHTFAGATSDLTLTAEAINGFSDSATVKTTVNFVAGASISANRTWVVVNPLEDKQEKFFTLSVRNVNNGREGGLINEDTIDLSIEYYTFYNGWDGSIMDVERWNASLDTSNTTVGGGEVDDDIQLGVYVPVNPYNGSGYVRVRADPRGEGMNPGAVLSDYIEVYVYVTQKASVQVTTLDPANQEGAPKDTLSYNFTITNTGNGLDMFNLSVASQHNWRTVVMGNKFTDNLTPGENATIEVQITIPAYDMLMAPFQGTDIGSIDNLTLYATSTFNIKAYDFDNATTTVIQGYGVELTPENSTGIVKPLGTVDYNITVKNIGNGEDKINFVHNSPPKEGWSVSLSRQSIQLDKGESTYLIVTVIAGELASVDDPFFYQLNGISNGDPSKNDTANMTTNVSQTADVLVNLLSPDYQSGDPGDVITFLFTVENTGNGEDTFNLSANASTINWTVELSKSQVTLPSFNQTSVQMLVYIPSLGGNDDLEDLQNKEILMGTLSNIKFTATSEYDRNISDSKTVQVEVNQFFKPRISAVKTREDVLPGRTIDYVVMVKNRGNGPDNITFTNQETSPHSGYSVLSVYSVPLAPGMERNISLKVTPQISLSPYMDEEYINMLIPMSDDLETEGNSITFTTTITFMDLIDQEPEKNINISTGDNIQQLNYQFEIMNIPDADGVSQTSDTFLITLFKDNALVKRGWTYNLSRIGSNLTDSMDIMINGNYIAHNFSLMIQASSSPNEIGKEIEIDVQGQSVSRSSLRETVQTTTFVAHIDLTFAGNIEFNKENFKEGGTLKMTVTLSVDGTVPTDDVEVGLYINGKLIDTQKIEGGFKLDRQTTSSSRSLHFTWSLPKLDWDEKAAEYNIELKVDTGNSIYETSSLGSNVAEQNNEISSTIWVEDDSIHPVISALLLVLCIGGAIYLFGILKDNRNLYILFGLFSGIIGASLFALPWYDFGLSGNTATTVGKVIIWTFIILIFTVVALFVSLTSKSYIEQIIENKKQRDKARFEFFRKKEGDAEKKEGIFSKESKLKPYILAGVAGLIQAPIFFILITLYSLSSITFMYCLLGLLYAGLSLAGVYFLIKVDLSVYKHISDVERIIDEIREDSLNEIDLKGIPGSEGDNMQRGY